MIKSTNQGWKFVLFVLGHLSGGGIMYVAFKQLDKNDDLFIALMLSGVATVMTTMLLACIFIRCPKCKLSWFWYAMSKKKANEWFPWLLTFSECPRCEELARDKTNYLTSKFELQNEAPS